MTSERDGGEREAERRLAMPRIVCEPRNVTVEMFRALADPIRLELLAQIAARGPLCVCHLQEGLALQPVADLEAPGHPAPGWAGDDQA